MTPERCCCCSVSGWSWRFEPHRESRLARLSAADDCLSPGGVSFSHLSNCYHPTINNHTDTCPRPGLTCHCLWWKITQWHRNTCMMSLDVINMTSLEMFSWLCVFYISPQTTEELSKIRGFTNCLIYDCCVSNFPVFRINEPENVAFPFWFINFINLLYESSLCLSIRAKQNIFIAEMEKFLPVVLLISLSIFCMWPVYLLFMHFSKTKCTNSVTTWHHLWVIWWYIKWESTMFHDNLHQTDDIPWSLSISFTGLTKNRRSSLVILPSFSMDFPPKRSIRYQYSILLSCKKISYTMMKKCITQSYWTLVHGTRHCNKTCPSRYHFLIIHHINTQPENVLKKCHTGLVR